MIALHKAMCPTTRHIRATIHFPLATNNAKKGIFFFFSKWHAACTLVLFESQIMAHANLRRRNLTGCDVEVIRKTCRERDDHEKNRSNPATFQT